MTRPANPALPQQIIEAGEKIVIAEGYEGLNMRKLAKRVGVTATSIYHYFESKEVLLLKLKLAAAERLNARIRRIETGDDPARIIEDLGRVYIEFAEEFPRLYRFLFETPLAGLPLTTDDTPVLYHTYFVARKALERMRESGSVPVPAAVGATIGWTMLHGFCSLLLSGTLQPAEGMSAEQLKEIFMQTYAHGPMHTGGGASPATAG